MEINDLLKDEIKGSVEFFLDFTNLKAGSPGYGLTVDSTKKPRVASIASVGFSLTAWVIASERGFLDRDTARNITRSTLATLLNNVAHYRGFFAHYIDMDSGQRHRKCEYSTIDTALCLNGVITAAAYFDDPVVRELAERLLARVDWNFIVFERDGKTLFRMAYNPDEGGDYVEGEPGFINQWDMAAEQKMMYLQAATRVKPDVARRLYAGFSRDTRDYNGQAVIVNPGGTLFAYLFSEAWLDTARYLDPDGVDWFNNTRLAALANRDFCIRNADQFATYHANSWGLSAGDHPRGYEVACSEPCLVKPRHTGTVSIYSAVSCLPYAPTEVEAMIEYLYNEQPQTWGKYGFFDAYNLAMTPPWYSSTLYGIDKGCSMIMIENALSRLVWETYTNSAEIQKALSVLNFKQRAKEQA
jgi:hypothetical protein